MKLFWFSSGVESVKIIAAASEENARKLLYLELTEYDGGAIYANRMLPEYRTIGVTEVTEEGGIIANICLCSYWVMAAQVSGETKKLICNYRE